MDNWHLFVMISLCVTEAYGSPQLLFANRENLRFLDAANPKGSQSLVVKDLKDAAAVDFIYSENMIFWTDLAEEAIFRAVINGTRRIVQPVITTGVVSPDGMACDWIGRNLYWTDSDEQRIEVSNLDGTFRKVLQWTDLDRPRAIALDPYNGYMYWTDWGEFPSIARSGMDGSPGTYKLLVHDDVYWPNGLTIDFEYSRLIWTDAKLNKISSCDFLGKNRQIVVYKDLPHPFAVTLYGDTLYWTDWQSNSIQSCNKVTGKERKTITRGSSFTPMDIRAYMPSRQRPAPNPCGENNGGCSHLCLLSPSDPHYSCACPTGVKLKMDGRICNDGPEEIILVARRTDLRKISLDTPDHTDIILPLTNISHAIAIDFDPVDGYVYWTDDEVKTIRRARLDGTGEEVLVRKEVSNPDGIAVDWIGRNLYWADTGTDRIEIARLNGTSRKVLVSEGLDEPRAISLDPYKGYMYWTDWGRLPKIERSYLDGTNREAIINSNLGWPNGLAADLTEDRIFWADAKTDKIESSSSDGTDRQVLLQGVLPHIFGFSLLGDYLYWTDWQSRSIERVNKRTGRDRSIIVKQLPDLMGLKAISVRKVEGTNPCAVNNGLCSHLCMFTPNGPTCACPDGFLLINKHDCAFSELQLLITQYGNVKKLTPNVNPVASVFKLPIERANAFKIDVDLGDERVYWIDKDKRVRRSFMNGTTAETLIEHGGSFPADIAFDWLAKNIYWVDSDGARIEVARHDGSSRRIIVWNDLGQPVALALDPVNGYMYWVDISDPCKIERAGLDGQHRAIILKGIGRVFSIVIDSDQQRIYWADMDKLVIESARVDGTNRQLLTKGDIASPMALAQFKDRLYWVDSGLRRIEAFNKATGDNRTTIAANISNVMDILALSPKKQSGWNTCYGENGGCSHLCFSRPVVTPNTSQTHICSCPIHYTLDADGKTCAAPTSFLVVSQSSRILRVVDHKNSSGDFSVELPIKRQRIKAVEFDPVNRFVYWVQAETNAIKRAKDDGSEVQYIVDGYETRPYDLALDPFSLLLFWSCKQTDEIKFLRTDLVGDSQVDGVVVNSGKPRYLALNPLKGHIYWTNMASPGSVHKALYDGTQEVRLFTIVLGRPGPITVDHAAGMLFWTDSNRNVIGISDLNGENRRTLLQKKVTGLAVIQNFLYFIDKGKNTVKRANKYTGTDMAAVLSSQVPVLRDIHAVVPTNLLHFNNYLCTVGNGQCSHLCIPSSNFSARCSCPKDLELGTDDRTCVKKVTCGSNEFSCESGSIKCIPKVWRCDGVSECEDRSDEKNCHICNATQYLCGYEDCRIDNVTCNAANVCIPCNHHSVYDSLINNYCFADFVLKAKVEKVLYENKVKLLILKGKRNFYKGGSSEIARVIHPVIKPYSACGCEVVHTVTADERILIMGTRDGVEYKVTYLSKIRKERDFNRAIRAFSSGHNCTRPNEETTTTVTTTPAATGNDTEWETLQSYFVDMFSSFFQKKNKLR